MLLASHSGGAVNMEDLNEFWYFQFETVQDRATVDRCTA
jgi:hypothetical protein